MRLSGHWAVLTAAVLLSGALGSVHAFSVFIAPLEHALGATRAEISLIYSLAIVSLTAVMLVGHAAHVRIAPPLLASATCLVAALGLLAAGWSGRYAGFLVGYGLLFGAANGMGYGYALYLAARAVPARIGFGMGAVTAAYALGATVFAKVFALLIARAGVSAALAGLAAFLVVVGLGAALLLWRAGLAAQGGDAVARVARPVPRRGLVTVLWAGFGLGSAAGLMAMGHAAGIVAAVGGRPGEFVLGAMLIGLGNACGGLAAGWLCDRWPAARLMAVLSGGSALVLFALAGMVQPAWVIAGLTLVGFFYGALVAVYPVAVSGYFGPRLAGKVYGRVFTAWGLAGLAGPWMAGAVYDVTGHYGPALAIAGAAALGALAVAIVLLRRPQAAA